MTIVAPSLLAADFSRLSHEIARVASADWLHVDVMDGHFVPNITLGPVVVHGLRKLTPLPLDVHLMVEEPSHLLESFVDAGADRLTVHAEATIHLHRRIQEIHDLGVPAGVALNPATPLEQIKYVLDQVDLVLVMTVNPGFGGQRFLPETLTKLAELDRLRSQRGLEFHIEVDGGINVATARDVVSAGADVLVAGTAIFRASDPDGEISKLRYTQG